MTQSERNELGKTLRECYDLQKKCPVFGWEFWAELLTAIEQQLTETQAATVERCREFIDSLVGPVTVANGRHAAPAVKVTSELNSRAICDGLRALLPDPHAKERWELEARLNQARLWNTLLGDDPKTLTWREQDIADLERQLKALEKEKK